MTAKGTNNKHLLYLVIALMLFLVLCNYMTTDSNNRHHHVPYCSYKDCPAVTDDFSRHYLIKTPGCTIPDFDPSMPSLLKYKLTVPWRLKCFKKSPITEEEGYSLLFYQERIREYTNSSFSSVNCSFQGIRRVEQKPEQYNGNCDTLWNFTEKIQIKEKVTHIEEEGILVTCDDQGQNGTNIYKNVHVFIQPIRVQHKRAKFKADVGDRENDRNLLSVIIMGTDAVSRGNLRRHMPQTFKYLTKDLRGIDLQGYNKVGDNTDPNLTAMLMGQHGHTHHNVSCVSKTGGARYDDCPIIWKHFDKKGYVTAFGEDAPWMGVFHYQKAGFCKQPTDYYNRPYFYASETQIGHNDGAGGSNGILCQGGKLSSEVIHSYSLKIAEHLRDMPYFGFYWTASATHDYLDGATVVDKPHLKYLKRLKKKGYLEHTILFFISDHGLRWGDFRSTYAGMLEERLPYVIMVFPEWFTQKYPQAIANLRSNTRRLTSNFDIYVTLLDIVNQAYADPAKSAPVIPQRGLSLFKLVPANRTCEDAGVPEHYCACEHTREVDPSNPKLLEAAKETLKDINTGLLRFKQCAQLSINKVLNGRVGSANKRTMPKKNDTVTETYVITFTTTPGDALLEATLKYQEKKYELTGDVSRVNKYGNQSHCLDDYVYRKYCYCKDLLNKT